MNIESFPYSVAVEIENDEKKGFSIYDAHVAFETLKAAMDEIDRLTKLGDGKKYAIVNTLYVRIDGTPFYPED